MTDKVHNSWLMGLLIPCVLVIYGISCIITQSAFMFSDIRFGGDLIVAVDGTSAIAIGIACIGFGVFIHCEVWRPNSVTWRFYPLGSILGMIAFIMSLIYYVVEFILHTFS